ncbi:hypothetical protein BDY21DRAFT_286470 [Lineolata rhizophorae]|uniref:PH domain-like protein n=1 Tax=Lineolata rhizophorae TaxID=578093 RepID=A0A6A6NZU3_9PEZI|nr:hypothetical protein BDY21DRAFT_286470 [Lineolata rhizophorae]
MTSRKSRSRGGQTVVPPTTSDYDTDAPPPISTLGPNAPSRSNAQLNLSVLQRHNTLVSGIVSIAPYAVVYLFTPTSQQWEKSGIEGTMFVCALRRTDTGIERFCVIILNRRGLNNFELELTSTDGIELTEDFIILRADNNPIHEDEFATPQFYGLWIFSEPPPSSTSDARAVNAQVIHHCAAQAEATKKAVEEKIGSVRGNYGAPSDSGDDNLEEDNNEEALSAPMGRQLSLRELFGQQRELDSGWSIHNHNSPARQPQFKNTPDTDFFRSTSSFGAFKSGSAQPFSKGAHY